MSHGLVENHRRSGDAMSSADELLSLLETRRSVAMTLLTDPGPSKDQLRRMLTIAARVPDHGALQPWRFIVIDGVRIGITGKCDAPDTAQIGTHFGVVVSQKLVAQTGMLRKLMEFKIH